MKYLLSLLLGISVVLGIGKCAPNKEKPILDSLNGTTWYMDEYISPEKYPGVPEKYIGETMLYYEFGATTAKRFAFHFYTLYDHNVVTGYEYPGYEESTFTYTLNGNQLSLTEVKDGEAASSAFTIESPTSMVYSGGMKYLRK